MNNFINYKYEVILALCWLIIQLVIFKYYGIKQPVDSPVYLSAAENIIEKGVFPDSHDKYYLSYITFIAAIFFVGGDVRHVICAQIVLSGVAALFLYLSVFKISMDRVTACISLFLFIFWIKIHQWNVYIYTESLFTSLLIISFFILINLKSWKHYLLAFPIFLFTFCVRPPGIALILSLLIFLLTKLKLRLTHEPRLKGSFSIIFLSLSIIIILLINRILFDFSFLESYLKAEVIYPNIPFLILRPNDLFIPDQVAFPLLKVLSFIFHNPFYFLKLSIIKLLLFFGNVKPYFSWKHNIFIMLYLYPTYFFAIKGRLSSNIEKPTLNFLVSIIMVQGIIVMLTSENWDGRFLVPALPFVFILAAFGIRKSAKSIYVQKTI